MILTKGGYEKVDFWALDGLLYRRLRELNYALDNKVDICIHCGVEGLHSPTGFHPKGEAVDLHFEQDGIIIQPEAMILMLLRSWNGGIGVYTYWNNPGFHLDVGPTRTWWKKDATGKLYTLAEYLKQSGLEEYA